ncbi:MAG: hypothetical protein R3C01_13425 [Planctomycetaceae bacterium]
MTADLTRYHPSLVIGAEGHTTQSAGLWSRTSDRFVPVLFPASGQFDILWDSLEIIDAEYIAEVEARKVEHHEALRSATNVVCAVGPRGGFRYVSYEFRGKDGIRHSGSTSFKSEAEELMELFESYGITIEERKVGRRMR